MAALKKLFSPSIFTTPISSSISSLWKKPKDEHDHPPPTPRQQLIMGSSGTHDDVIHGDVVVDVEAPPAPIAPTSPSPPSQLGLKRRSSQQPTSTPALPSASIPSTNMDSHSKRIRKMVVPVAILFITFSGLLIVNPRDINLMNVDSPTKSVASISNVLDLVPFCFGAWLIFHGLMCGHLLDHLNDIWVQKGLMLIGVVFMALSLLFRTLVTPSGTLLALVSWMPALFTVILTFAFLQMVFSYKFSAGMADPGPAAGGMGNLPV